MNIDAIAGPFYNIIKVMMKGPNKRSNLKKFCHINLSAEILRFQTFNACLTQAGHVLVEELFLVEK